MLLRDALRMVKASAPNTDRRVSLVCSFEPLHLRTFLQAHLLEVAGPAAPLVETFGYDRLEDGLAASAGALKVHPAVLFLTWEDIHPRLGWRSRGGFRGLDPDEIQAHGDALGRRLEVWLEKRGTAESYLLLPPQRWMAWVDEGPGGVAGLREGVATAVSAAIGVACQRWGARVVCAPEISLNFRDLLGAGCPLTVEDGDAVAGRLAALLRRTAVRRKVLVLDLDGTLWHGVIGEDGAAAISARPEGAGFPHHVFQHLLLRMKDEGVLLAFCSKNNPNDVLPVFDSLDMPLKVADFAAWRCNWIAKSQNLAEIATELNVGVDSLVYVDDNPAEVAEITSRVPAVSCLTAPRSAAEWPALWERLREAFWTWRVSDEDRLRTESIRVHSAAVPVERSGPDDGAAYLRALDLQLEINASAFDDPRSLELINKTNQFNLTGLRMDQADWLALKGSAGAACLSARLRDRYGDFGTIAVIASMARGDGLEVRQMVVSCRAFGRGVEHALLAAAASRGGVATISGPFVDTGRNAPARAFLAELGVDGETTQWSLPSETVLRAAARLATETGVRVSVREPSEPQVR